MRVKFLSRNSEVFKIYTNYLSCLVYNQVYNLFVCTLCPCLTSFPQWNWDMQTTTKFPLARNVTCHVKRPFETWLRYVNMTHSDCCWVEQKKKWIPNLHVVGMLDNLNAVLRISGLWSPSFQWSPKSQWSFGFSVTTDSPAPPPPPPIPQPYYRLILCLRHQSLIVHSRSKVVHVYSLLHDEWNTAGRLGTFIALL